MATEKFPPCPECNAKLAPGWNGKNPPAKYRRALKGKKLWFCPNCIQWGGIGLYAFAPSGKATALAAFPKIE